MRSGEVAQLAVHLRLDVERLLTTRDAALVAGDHELANLHPERGVLLLSLAGRPQGRGPPTAPPPPPRRAAPRPVRARGRGAPGRAAGSPPRARPVRVGCWAGRPGRASRARRAPALRGPAGPAIRTRPRTGWRRSGPPRARRSRSRCRNPSAKCGIAKRVLAVLTGLRAESCGIVLTRQSVVLSRYPPATIPSDKETFRG